MIWSLSFNTVLSVGLAETELFIAVCCHGVGCE